MDPLAAIAVVLPLAVLLSGALFELANLLLDRRRLAEVKRRIRSVGWWRTIEEEGKGSSRPRTHGVAGSSRR